MTSSLLTPLAFILRFAFSALPKRFEQPVMSTIESQAAVGQKAWAPVVTRGLHTSRAHPIRPTARDTPRAASRAPNPTTLRPLSPAVLAFCAQTPQQLEPWPPGSAAAHASAGAWSRGWTAGPCPRAAAPPGPGPARAVEMGVWVLDGGGCDSEGPKDLSWVANPRARVPSTPSSPSP